MLLLLSYNIFPKMQVSLFYRLAGFEPLSNLLGT